MLILVEVKLLTTESIDDKEIRWDLQYGTRDMSWNNLRSVLSRWVKHKVKLRVCDEQPKKARHLYFADGRSSLYHACQEHTSYNIWVGICLLVQPCVNVSACFFRNTHCFSLFPSLSLTHTFSQYLYIYILSWMYIEIYIYIYIYKMKWNIDKITLNLLLDV